MSKYVAYYRMSTKGQGQSGLGLEAQRAAVRQFVKHLDHIIEEFTEVESGKRNNRAQLQAAIDLAKKKRANLDKAARQKGLAVRRRNAAMSKQNRQAI